MLLLAPAMPVGAAVFYMQTFSGTTEGWSAGGDGLTVSQSPDYGAGALEGTFQAQGRYGQPQTGEFLADTSGAPFGGDYNSSTNPYVAFQFDFYAAGTLPSSLTFHMSDGANNFYMVLDPQNSVIQSPDQWYTLTVPLSPGLYNQYWYGGTANQFSNMLSHVTTVGVEVTRNGRGEQSYYIDNFRIMNDLLLVPEPTSGLFWFGWALVFGGLRSKLGRRQRSPYALPAARAS